MNALWEVSALVVWLTVWFSAPPAGLAEIAKREAHRRQTTAKSTASLSNLGWPVEPPPGAVTLPDPPATASGEDTPPPAAATGKAEQPKPASKNNDEPYWRDRLATARSTVEKGEFMAQAMQSQINALQRDSVNFDNPVQANKARAELRRSMDELDRLNRQIEADKKAIAALLDEARRLGVPAGWVR